MTLGLPRVNYRETDSTNLRLLELAELGAPHGTLVTADSQRAGRGRDGRSWHSLPGQSLMFSVLLRLQQPLASLLVAAAVRSAVTQLRAVDEEQVKIKWPNDLLLAGKKFAGILIQARPQKNYMVVGVGLNVSGSIESFPPELRDIATTLGLPAQVREELLALVLEQLADWLAAGEEEILEYVRRHDYLLGKEVITPDGQGRACGISDQGLLIVERAGVAHQHQAGEIQVQ